MLPELCTCVRKAKAIPCSPFIATCTLHIYATMDRLFQLSDTGSVGEFKQQMQAMWTAADPPSRRIMTTRLVRHAVSMFIRIAEDPVNDTDARSQAQRNEAFASTLRVLLRLSVTHDMVVFFAATLLLSVIDRMRPYRARYTLVTDDMRAGPLIARYRPMSKRNRVVFFKVFSFLGSTTAGDISHYAASHRIAPRTLTFSALLRSADDYRSQLHGELEAAGGSFLSAEARSRSIGDDAFLGDPVGAIRYAPVLSVIAWLWDHPIHGNQAPRRPDFAADDALAQVWATDPDEAMRMVQLRSRAMQAMADPYADSIPRRQPEEEEEAEEEEDNYLENYRSIHGEVGLERIREPDSDDEEAMHAHEYVTSESEDEDEAHAALVRRIAELEEAQRQTHEELERLRARLRSQAREDAEEEDEERYRH